MDELHASSPLLDKQTLHDQYVWYTGFEAGIMATIAALLANGWKGHVGNLYVAALQQRKAAIAPAPAASPQSPAPPSPLRPD